MSKLVSKFNLHGGGVQGTAVTPHRANIHPRKAAGQKLLHQISLRGNEIECLPDDAPVLRFLNLDAIVVPPSWHSLERRCIEAEQGRRKEFKKALSPRLYTVPFIVSTAVCQCSITGTVSGRRFLNKAVNRFLADLFSALPKAVETVKLPETALSRYDLHHAHLFCDQTHGLGLLFHSKEYIVSGNGEVDVGNLGNCQIGTPLEFESEAMAWRNIIWYVSEINFCISILTLNPNFSITWFISLPRRRLGAGQAASINVGHQSPLNMDLLMDGLHEVCTILEDDLGETLADIYYIEELGKHGGRARQHRLFVNPK